MNLEGRLLGNRYEIIEKIGNGGMAMVYKAKCHVLNRFVAVKILRDEFTTDEEFIKRFEVEAQAAASITHPNIVSVYDVGREGNLYYIVMELIRGKTLKEIIVEEEGPLPWKWSVNIAIQIASALDVAHKNNIVHRDIKPHNIIITEDGVAKVTDFGIAKAVSNSTMTAFGTTIGSVHYFSPEHARGGYTDAKSDLYSLGVVMYEMLTGKVPFDADTPVSVALKHMQEEPTEPIEINEKVPSAVNDIILKAMRKDSSLRYQNATAMLSDLNKALKDPEGDFVDNDDYAEDFPTQKISTEEIEEAAKRAKGNNGKTNFIKEHKALSIIIGIILLFALSLGGTLAYLHITVPKETEVPNLLGVSKEEAKKQVEDKKLVFEVEKEEYNSEYAEGYVISQDPNYRDNFNVKEGTTVKVTVSLGIEEAIVPKVTGMSENDAITALEDAKLKYEIVEETSKKVEAGYVISQETTQGTKVYAGDIVRIHVSKGPDMAEVVSVIEKSEDEAKKALTDLGLKVNVLYEEDATKNNGTVLKQSINAGEKVEKDSTVTITVNKISETKSATLTVNVKSLLGGKVEYENVVDNTVASSNTTNTTNTTGNEVNETNTTVTKKVKNVKVKIMVGSDTVYNDSVDPTTTSLIQSISGKGTVTVKVYIDDVLAKGTPKDINLNTTDKVTIE